MKSFLKNWLITRCAHYFLINCVIFLTFKLLYTEIRDVNKLIKNFENILLSKNTFILDNFENFVDSSVTHCHAIVLIFLFLTVFFYY